MSPADEAALRTAIDADGITPEAIAIHSGGDDGWIDHFEVVIAYGAPRQSSAGLCRGNAYWYAPSDRDPRKWERAPTALGYAIIQTSGNATCSVTSFHQRILLIGNPDDPTLSAILKAVRAAATAADGSSSAPRIIEVDPARSKASVETGNAHTVLLVRAPDGWSVLTTTAR